MEIKTKIKTKIKNIIGINDITNEINKLKAINIVKSLKFDNNIQDEWLLSQFPTLCGGIRKSINKNNIKTYLNLIRPIYCNNLKRFGGSNDGGYVMMLPPPYNK